jgi:hypothetical protein
VGLDLAARAGDRVDLVDEDDRGPVGAGALEELADVPLRLPHLTILLNLIARAF